ncbi:MAG TPA: hypothetical protein VLE51_03830 [Candidatus Saccharimonadales bacterium]|nr:hypothetical protein [Candidatus Saccharimonadales bacterium]
MDESIHTRLLEKAREYHTPQAARDLLATHPPLIITGITASGKDSVSKYISETSELYREVVTHTTRPPRAGEVHTQHYHFVTEEDMLKLVEREEMIEVKLIHGETFYGTSINAYRDVVNSGHRPLLVIDVQGVDEITKYIEHARPIFLLPPSFNAWIERLEKRGRMSHPERLRRMNSARVELEKTLNSNLFVLVVNHDIPRTAHEILSDAHDYSIQHHNRETALLLIEHLRNI